MCLFFPTMCLPMCLFWPLWFANCSSAHRWTALTESGGGPVAVIALAQNEIADRIVVALDSLGKYGRTKALGACFDC